jgi:hypothetical protein
MKREPIRTMKPIAMNANPTSQTRIRGSTRTATPNAIMRTPGTSKNVLAIGLLIMLLQVAAIGHIGMDVCSAISSSLSAFR